MIHFGKYLSSETQICRFDFYIRYDSDAMRVFIYITCYILINFTIKYHENAPGKIVQISHKVTLIYLLDIQHIKIEGLYHLHSVVMCFHTSPWFVILQVWHKIKHVNGKKSIAHNILLIPVILVTWNQYKWLKSYKTQFSQQNVLEQLMKSTMTVLYFNI